MKHRMPLDADPGSVRLARQFTVEVLAQSGRLDDADVAELLVSELVTNAVLHARSPVELTVQIENDRLRVEVFDASRAVPTPRAHDRESQTGRGLELVASLSERWGVELDDGPERQRSGKAVWFELGLRRAEPAGPDGAGAGNLGPEQASASSGQAPVNRVCLQGVPLALFRESQEHQDGLTREFALIDIDHPDATAIPDRLARLSEDLTDRLAGETEAVLAQISDAEKRGELTVDLMLDLSAGASGVIADVVDLLEEADRFCAEGALLTLAASDAVQGFRRWCATEIATQLGGGNPTRWHPI